MGKFVVTLTAIIFVLYGFGFAVSPESMSDLVTGGFPVTKSGLIDMRSTYGGLSIAVGALLWNLTRRSELLPLGLRAVAIIMGAMATTRTIGFVVDGSPNPTMWAFLVAEITAVSLSLWQIRIESQEGEGSNKHTA
jgi:hypothetical protein